MSITPEIGPVVLQGACCEALLHLLVFEPAQPHAVRGARVSLQDFPHLGAQNTNAVISQKNNEKVLGSLEVDGDA